MALLEWRPLSFRYYSTPVLESHPAMATSSVEAARRRCYGWADSCFVGLSRILIRIHSVSSRNSRAGEHDQHGRDLSVAGIGCHYPMHRVRISSERQLLDEGGVQEVRIHHWTNRVGPPEGAQ